MTDGIGGRTQPKIMTAIATAINRFETRDLLGILYTATNAVRNFFMSAALNFLCAFHLTAPPSEPSQVAFKPFTTAAARVQTFVIFNVSFLFSAL